MKILVKLQTLFRKHTYDLAHPINVKNGIIVGPCLWPVYECKGCGKTVCIDKRLMNDLPFSIARGCPGEYPKETVLPTPENPFPRGL